MSERRGRTSSTGRQGPAKQRFPRPNPLRQLLWVAVALAALALGYGIALLIPGTSGESGPPAATSELAPLTSPDGSAPWYRSQPPPPVVAGVPDTPIYPDHPPGNGGAAHRAYEESLPAEVYVPEAAGHLPGATASVPPREMPVKDPSASTAVAPDSLPRWRRFALATPASEGRPRIAIVIDDLGVDKHRTARTIALPAPLTLAFLSYASELEQQTAAARAAGHELLVHVPMQPHSDTVDPGPNVLRDDLDGEELLRRLRWCLDRFPGYVGINNHMGSRFTAEEPGMAVVMTELKARGLLFLDSRTTGTSVGSRLAAAGKVPFAVRNVFLDNDNEIGAVRARLAETEALAARHGVAIAIGHPRDATLEALPAWIESVRARGFQLVPVSATVTIPGGVG